MKKNELITYENILFGDVRTMIIDSEPWFVGNDIAEALGYKELAKAVRENCRPKGCLFRTVPTKGGNQRMRFIDEGNMYRLVMRSNMPWATKFQDWICDEVIPAIRKYGKYEIEWAKAREVGKLSRISLTDAIKMSNENERLHGHAFTLYTDLIYKTIFGKTAKQLKRVRGLSSDVNLRDYLSADELRRVDVLEATITGLLLMGKQYQEIKSVITMPKLLG